MKEYNPFILVQ